MASRNVVALRSFANPEAAIYGYIVQKPNSSPSNPEAAICGYIVIVKYALKNVLNGESNTFDAGHEEESLSAPSLVVFLFLS